MAIYYCICSGEAWTLKQAESPEAAAKAHVASVPYEAEARSVTVEVYVMAEDVWRYTLAGIFKINRG